MEPTKNNSGMKVFVTIVIIVILGIIVMLWWNEKSQTEPIQIQDTVATQQEEQPALTIEEQTEFEAALDSSSSFDEDEESMNNINKEFKQ